MKNYLDTSIRGIKFEISRLENMVQATGLVQPTVLNILPIRFIVLGFPNEIQKN